MNPPDLSVMSEATQLTREGRLHEATALLQGRATPSPTSRSSSPAPTSATTPGTSDKLRRLLGRLHAPVAAQHSSAAGERTYRLHVPPQVNGPAPLVVMLHGGTQDAASFEAATKMSRLSDKHGFLALYPEQSPGANPMRYWNWFAPEDQHRGGGEPAILARLVRRIRADHPVDPQRVYVAGFSAGAAMAAVLAATYPDVFAAVGVHSGLAYGAADNVASAFAAMRTAPAVRPVTRPVPIIVFHGDTDTTVDPSNSTAVLDQFCPADRPRVATRGNAGRGFTQVSVGEGDGELWLVHGAGHTWSGGAAGGSYTDPVGPDASAEMVRFFARHGR